MTDAEPTDSMPVAPTVAMVALLLILGPIGAIALTPSAVGTWTGPDAVLGVSPANLEAAIAAGVAIGLGGAALALLISRWWRRSVSFLVGAAVESAMLAGLWVLAAMIASV